MQFFHKRTSLLLVLLCLPLLFFPKINIIQLDRGETAGLRIDDFILLGFSFLLLWAHFSLRKGFLRIEMWMIILVVFSFFSFFINKLLFTLNIIPVNAKIFYCVRIFEYFMFFYIGALATKCFNLDKVIKAFFLWNMLLMIMQKIGIIGEFNSSSGYSADGAYRVSGIASFPSEMGALLNLIFCYFLFAPKKTFPKLPPDLARFMQRTYIYWLFIIFAVLIIMTGSRIAIVALIIPFLFKLKSELRVQSLSSLAIVVSFLVCAVAALVFFITQTESIAVRSKGLLSWRNVDLARAVWDAQNISIGIDNLSEVSYEGHDLSWWIRIHKWCYALKLYCYTPECYLQGIGPGFAWLALDGGLLRILVEYGLIGYYIFWQFFRSIYNQNSQLKWMVVAFMINMIFFDIYLAYKPMSLLFFVTGYVYSTARTSVNITPYWPQVDRKFH